MSYTLLGNYVSSASSSLFAKDVLHAKIRRFPCLAFASTHLSWKGFQVISRELGLETHSNKNCLQVFSSTYIFRKYVSHHRFGTEVLQVDSQSPEEDMRVLLDACQFYKLASASFFNDSTTRNYYEKS